jgi:tetratricopeptide (TPR) repeat protein
MVRYPFAIFPLVAVRALLGAVMPKFLSRLLRRTPDFSARLPRPRFLPRFAALVVSGTVLGLLAASFAGHPMDPPGWLDPFGAVVTHIRHVTAGVGVLFGKDADAAAVIGARIEFFVVAVAVIISLRWLKFWWLTVRPGPIEVAHLDEASTSVDIGSEQNTEQAALGAYVTMMLREKLSSVSVYLPTPTPGEAVGGGFLQTMRESSRESWWATTIEVISRIIPRSAYRVDGAILHRPGNKDSCGVSVRVTVLPRQRTVAGTVWAPTPEQAAERAARVVAAAILPLTRRCLASPWRHWHGRSLPVELLDDYEEASAFRQQRRYDEALGRYRSALGRDSLNPLIRLEMAQIQEQLGLYLDALATYNSALVLWSGSPERYNSWLHGRQVDGTGRHRFTAWQRLGRWRRYGNPFLARFRYATALAYFEKLTPQWIKLDATDPRSRERSRLRHMLVKTLAERYGPVWRDGDGGPRMLRHAGKSHAEELKTKLTDLTEKAQPDDGAAALEAKVELKRIFILMSRYELQQLVRDHRSWLGWVDDSELTTRSLKMAHDSWITLRLEVAARGRDEANESALAPGEAETLLGGLHRRIERATRSTSVWMDHYNAACVFGQALVLIGRDEQHRSFARAATKALFTGLESADSSHVSRQRSWILSEDADLRELRRCSEFQPFAAAIGSASGPVVLRPRRTQITELSEYSLRLVVECARTMESRWHADDGGDDGHAWWIVHQLTAAHRNWPDRLAAITYFRDRPAGAAPWQVALPDIATLDPPEADHVDAGHEHANFVETWSDALITQRNLCQIRAALWIRSHFFVDQANKSFTAAPGTAAGAQSWAALRQVVVTGRVPADNADIREEALRIINKANEALADRQKTAEQLTGPEFDWENQAWQWAEMQRVTYPNKSGPPDCRTTHALARAFAALALAYDAAIDGDSDQRIGDASMPLSEARRLIGT